MNSQPGLLSTEQVMPISESSVNSPRPPSWTSCCIKSNTLQNAFWKWPICNWLNGVGALVLVERHVTNIVGLLIKRDYRKLSISIIFKNILFFNKWMFWLDIQKASLTPITLNVRQPAILCGCIGFMTLNSYIITYYGFSFIQV